MLTVFLMWCQIAATGGVEKCQPIMRIKPSWEVCMAESDELNKMIMSGNWRYVCDVRETIQL